jgi:hypothetical protein
MKTNLRRWPASLLLIISLVFLTAAGSARAQIFYGGVSLAEPTNGASFFAPADVKITAYVPVDPDNGVTVTFYADRHVIGVVSNGVASFAGAASGRDFTFDWTNVAVGPYALQVETMRRFAGSSEWSLTNFITVLPSHYISVDIVQPTNGTTYAGPTNIDLLAGGLDTNGAVAFVEFFDGAQRLGFVTNGAVLDPGPPPGFPPGWKSGDRAYFLDWTNQSIGTHTLIAAIVDTNGETAYSPPLTIIIGSNLPPKVQLTSPPNDAVFYAPINVSIVAYATDPDGLVATVQFFAGTTNLGFGDGFQPPIEVPLTPVPLPLAPAPLPVHLFMLTWTNPPVGSYNLTAVATDELGASSTSSPVAITILPQVTPPPTNLPDVVGIVATDPIAIASTNCWIWRGLANGAGTWTQWISPIAIWHWYTNCGPKDATFTVHRIGAIGSDLSVNYSINGSATNGIDYVALTGSVTIPAGENSAVVTIVPLQNGSNYTRTVALSLDPSTNVPPDYLVGFDSRAEALITDDALLNFPEAALLGNGAFHLSLTGPNGAWFHVDYTTNLIDWIPLCTNQVVNGSIDFVDPNAGASRTRLYRTVPLLAPPPN